MEFFLYAAGGGLALAGAVAWSTYNRLMALDERCNTAFADVDVHLKHRHSLIPGLVETVRGFVGHEFAVLTEVTKARASALRATGPRCFEAAVTYRGRPVNGVAVVYTAGPVRRGANTDSGGVAKRCLPRAAAGRKLKASARLLDVAASATARGRVR